MDDLLFSRALMGISLGFHIIYATIGVGLPLMLMIAECLALKTGNDSYHRMARSWIRPAGVVFAIGAVSGTILSFELGFLWPRFMAFSGPLIGFAFWMEGFAFFTEAIFLALYSYGEQRLSRRMQFLCTVVITLAAAASALFVISANAWMNTPAGLRLAEGQIVEVYPLPAFFNPAWPHEALHGTLAAYAATGFAISGIYANSILSGKGAVGDRQALTLVLAVSSLSLPLMLASGDWAAVSVARQQPAKLAAMEALFNTTAGAPLIVGGWPDPATGRNLYAIELPRLLSLLAHRSSMATVQGLDAFPPDQLPDPRLVHPFFDLMVGAFLVMLAGAALFWWRYWRCRSFPDEKLPLRGVLLASPFGMIAVESGWLVTEFGRQPWIAQGLMRVPQGVTPNGGIGTILLLFVLVYLALTVGLLRLLCGLGSGRGESAPGSQP